MPQFSDLVEIVRNLTDRDIHPRCGTVTGNMTVSTPETLEALKGCVKESRKTGVELTGHPDIDSLTIGSAVRVEIGIPSVPFGLLSENIDALLRSPHAHVNEPPRYYLLDTGYYKEDPAPPGHVVGVYRGVLEFVGMLATCAAFIDKQNEILVFVKEGKFEVPVAYEEEDLRSADVKSLEALGAIIPKDAHEKQCSSIMAEAVYELTSPLLPKERFAWLLKHAQELKVRFEKGYELYASGFSYEKIRDEIEAARVEYSGKIHKVFSDIQNQLLGIPVATIIVATSMKETTKVDGNFWMDIVVLFGSAVFMVLTLFLLRNQRDTLDVIKIEIKRQKSKLGKEHAAIADNFISTFQSLDDRAKTQRCVLRWIGAIVVIGFVISLWYFYSLNLPIQKILAKICVVI